MLTNLAVGIFAFMFGVILMWVRRDDRLRDAEQSCLAATGAAAQYRRERDQERERLYAVIAAKDVEIEGLGSRLWDAEAELLKLRSGNDPEAA